MPAIDNRWIPLLLLSAIGPATFAAPRPVLAEPHEALSDAAAAGAPQAIPCDSATDVGALEAISKATSLLDSLWLTTQDGLFAAYTMPGEKRNPFDLKSAGLGTGGPREGIAQARKPTCTIEPDGEQGRYIVRFSAPFYRFHEKEAGWSPTLRNGLLLAVEVATSAAAARTIWPPQGVFEPEQKPRRPDPANLPRLRPWGEPMPACHRTERWTGEACVPRRRR